MSDVYNTLVSICLNSNDPIPRLALADYLEPQGSELGELLRLVCARLKELRCPNCSGSGQWRRGVHFEHEKICMKCKPHTVWEPDPYQYDARISVVQSIVLKPLLDGIKKEIGGKGWQPSNPYYREYMEDAIGTLWRECPYGCKYLREISLDYDCSCKGTGVLLEIPCPTCKQPNIMASFGLEKPHYMTCSGYVASPLLPLWQILKLVYDPAADLVRRGDTDAIIQLLK